MYTRNQDEQCPRYRCPLNAEPGCRHGDRTHGSNWIDVLLSQNPTVQILFVGSANCLRHKPFWRAAEYMREEKFSVLCPAMADFASGRYMTQVKEAVRSLSKERNTKEFVLIFSCQWVILSTDGELLKEELKSELGVDLMFYDDSHLMYGDHR